MDTMTQIQQFTDADTLALTKLVKEKAEKEARKNLQAGVYDINLRVHIHGSMSVGLESEKTPSISCDMLLKALALFAAYSGITPEQGIPTLVKALTQAMTGDEAGAKVLKLVLPRVMETYDKVKAEVQPKLPKIKSTGTCNAILAIDII